MNEVNMQNLAKLAQMSPEERAGLAAQLAQSGLVAPPIEALDQLMNVGRPPLPQGPVPRTPAPAPVAQAPAPTLPTPLLGGQ